MASSLSPNQTSQSGFGGGSSGQDKSPLSSLNLGFLKSLTEKRTARDGQPPKRRGPKPDSKPALTRRQELNRQAQRTHRERKELYIKALEDEVLRLKEIYSTISQDKDRLVEENRQLKALLAQNGMALGMALGGGDSLLDDAMSNPSVGYASSGSVTGSYAAPASTNTSAFTPPPLSATTNDMGHRGGGGGGGLSPHSHQHRSHGHDHHHQHSGQGPLSAGGGAASVAGGQPNRNPNRNPNLDYDQAGIDLVLTLEKPCMDHLPWLLERGTEVGGHESCGHALMASCPPEPFPELTPDIPFGYSNVRIDSKSKGNAIEASQRTWELSKADLATLLDLSKRLNLDGEITPVMAWGMVLAHPRLAQLSMDDFARLTEELGRKVRCYGFGAVMEEFEVRDALENVFSTKPEFGMVY
ncbi:AP-1-like transcription factor [Diplogelasinospora grovesii]|uniref:AP-1-like transcription factor n=1 Tax=Diplogelasinospora grovesii TaxID=303347 RepID=A0AAN6S333_9PEZI|nr:AP-1-like transcription factor [Diplogelasinospora grovesii]